MTTKRICIVNSYLNGRDKDCARGLYPRHQLWGADDLARRGYEVATLPSDSRRAFNRLSRKLTAATRLRLGNIEQEAQLIAKLGTFDFVYGVTAWDLFLLVWLRSLKLIRARIVVWIYAPQMRMPWLHRALRPGHFNRGLDGVLCLTRKTADYYRHAAPRASVTSIDWGADLNLFRAFGRPGEYFLCCGRTQRDFDTLLAAAERVSFPVKLIVPRNVFKNKTLPSNVEFAGGPESAADDKGIPYPELIEKYYANCRAVLVPLYDDPNNTAGLTNCIEAFAVGKPVIMTRTGCLDVDLAAQQTGIYVNPGDVDGWVGAMQKLAGDSGLALELGGNARRQAELHYNCDRFGRDVCNYFDAMSA